MNGSPLASYNSQTYFTPSRKPTQHHCNADRKQAPFVNLDQETLAPLCRNLFGDRQEIRPSVPNVNAKLFR
jgi:hypothetical protein